MPKYSTPRARFISSKDNVSSHNRILDSVQYQNSEDAAVAEYTRAVVALGSGKDLDGAGAQQAAAASFHMICGAYQFLEVFHRLSEPYPERKPQDKIESLTEVEFKKNN